MSGDLKPKVEDLQDTSMALKKKDLKASKERPKLDPGSYEVFRNNTTAVEVIVKDVFNKGKKCDVDLKIDTPETGIDRLYCELDNANKSLATARKGFQTITQVMRSQIHAANLKELDTHVANLMLKLENEKLRILLHSKTKLLSRMKKELTTIKRVLKFVVKSIHSVPEVPGNLEHGSDTDYEDFKNDLKENVRVKFATKIEDKSDTFETTVSTDNHQLDRKV